MPDGDPDASHDEVTAGGAGRTEKNNATDERSRVQCPNCCRLAFVTSRGMGLLFYECELCGTRGAAPDPHDEAEA